MINPEVRSMRRRLFMLDEVSQTNAAQIALGTLAPPWAADGWIEISALPVARGPREYDHLVADALVELAEPGAVTGWHVRLTQAGKAQQVELRRRLAKRTGRRGRGKAMAREQMSVVSGKAVREPEGAGPTQAPEAP